MAGDIGDKVAHVKSAGQNRKHHCHWPGCKAQVPPAKWGCTKHWYMLPHHVRSGIWAAYSIGQEQTMTPSESYLSAARKAQAWIRDNYSACEHCDGTTPKGKRFCSEKCQAEDQADNSCTDDPCSHTPQCDLDHDCPDRMGDVPT